MCGISGSTSRESGFDLYEQNLDRGYYSSSVTVLHDTGIYTFKKLGKLEVDDVPKHGRYYLFHSRGPTVETEEFCWDDNHPFTYGRFVVAHNGIIENADYIGDGNFSVDSKSIPFIIDEFERGREKDPIIKGFNQLKGTFGCWVLDTRAFKVHIVRHDITLFNYGVEFSSSNPGYLKEVPQDTLFEVDIEGTKIVEVGKLSLSTKPKYFVPK